MLKTRLQEDLKKALKTLGFEISSDVVISIPKNNSFGDYSTNIALQLAKNYIIENKQSVEQIANQISENLKDLDYLDKVEVVKPGFINFYLKPKYLMENLHQVCNYSSLVRPEIHSDQQKQKVLVEFGHANTHKAVHIGHMRNIILGECVCRMLESTGVEVFRANYQGDIGLHVAKALWGIENLDQIIPSNLDISKKVELLGKAYAKGATQFEKDETAKKEIYKINKDLYNREPKIVRLWEKTRKWSLEYFDIFYQKVGVKYDRLYFESEVEKVGKQIVLDNLNKVFFEDEGAVIFKGSEEGLHNRVFITSEGNPTYEAKEIGLAKLEYEEAKYDQSIHVVDVQQSGYFQVVIKAIGIIFDNLKGKKRHLPYGFVDLKGRKMSSRTGDVITFEFLYAEVRKRVANIMKNFKFDDREQTIDIVTIGAIKFTMLKYSPSTKIFFDLEKSVALDGDSGPYVQYTYARAKSVLRNASYDYQPEIDTGVMEPEERALLQKIEYFNGVIEQATTELSPTVVTTYLLEVARDFNLFYQKHPIIKAGQDKSEFRLALTCAIAVILKQGLYLLGIEAPERM